MTIILHTSILLGAMQGLVGSVLLFWHKPRSISRNILAVIVLLLSVACLNIILLQSGARYLFPILDTLAYVLPLTIVMPIGPLIFFYTQANVDDTFVWSRRHTMQLLPVLIDLLPYLGGIALLASRYILNSTDVSGWNNFIESAFTYIDIPRWLSMSFYVFLSHRLLLRNGIKGSSRWRWIVSAFMVFQFIWLIHLTVDLFPTMTRGLMQEVSWYSLYIAVSILVYWLSIHGYLSLKEKPKAASSRITPRVARETESILRAVMEKDRLYLDPDLGLDQLVKHVNVQQKIISATLNQHMSVSFSDFVNAYRVDEFKRRVLFPRNGHLTLTGLAMECGFNSQATFQRAFKKLTGQSPTGYVAALRSHKTDNKVRNTSQI